MQNHGHRTGERFRGKRIGYRRGSWIILPLAVVAWVLPTAPAQANSNLLTNGGFDGSTGWAVIQNGGSGVLFNGALRFSYQTGAVSQTVSVSPGQTLNVSFTVDNSQSNRVGAGDPISDTWTATLSSGETASSVTRSVAHGLETFSLSITTPAGSSDATLTFSGIDNGYWAGHYGPVVDNAVLTATNPTTTGVFVRGYNITQNAPPRVDTNSPDCEFTYTNINDWPDTYMAGCRADQVMLHYTGSIVVPTATARFRVYSDDGAWVTVGSNEFGYWGLRGCSYTESPEYEFSPGEAVTLDAWFYEWGGGECFRLHWDIGNGWEVVPASAFTSAGTPPTTTTTTTTTTTLPKVLGAPTNLSVENTESGVLINWDASQDDSGISPERYAVSWSTGSAGWGVATGNVGDANALNTQILLGYQLFESTGGLNTEYTFTVRADNDTYGVYSQVSESVTLTIDTPEVPTTWPESTSTTTSSTDAPTPSVDVPTTTAPVTSTDPTPTTISAPAPVTTTSSTSTTTDAPAEETTPPETTVAEPETTDPAPETTDPEPEPGTGDDVTELSPEELSDIEEPEQLEALIDSGNIDELDSEQLLSIVENDAFTELSAEAFGEVLDAVFDEPLSDEEFQDVLDSVLSAPISDEQFDELVDALGSDSVSDEQVQEAVDQIIENGITEEFATSLASSADILTSIDGEAAAEIFAEVPVSELTDEEAEQIVAAVQDASEEVRESFETEINIFGAGSLDTYVPIGSAVDVETRRVIIAATTVVSILTVASPPSSPAPSSPGGSGSGSGGPSGSGGGAIPEPSSERRRRLPGGR
jgi:hypothetical protein